MTDADTTSQPTGEPDPLAQHEWASDIIQEHMRFVSSEKSKALHVAAGRPAPERGIDAAVLRSWYRRVAKEVWPEGVWVRALEDPKDWPSSRGVINRHNAFVLTPDASATHHALSYRSLGDDGEMLVFVAPLTTPVELTRKSPCDTCGDHVTGMRDCEPGCSCPCHPDPLVQHEWARDVSEPRSTDRDEVRALFEAARVGTGPGWDVPADVLRQKYRGAAEKIRKAGEWVRSHSDARCQGETGQPVHGWFYVMEEEHATHRALDWSLGDGGEVLVFVVPLTADGRPRWHVRRLEFEDGEVVWDDVEEGGRPAVMEGAWIEDGKPVPIGTPGSTHWKWFEAFNRPDAPLMGFVWCRKCWTVHDDRVPTGAGCGRSHGDWFTILKAGPFPTQRRDPREKCMACGWLGAVTDLLESDNDKCPECGKVGSMTTVYGPDELRAHELDPPVSSDDVLRAFDEAPVGAPLEDEDRAAIERAKSELDPAEDWHLQAELGRAHDAGLLQEGPAARVAYLERLVGDAWRLMAREDRCQEAQIMLRNEVRAMRRDAPGQTTKENPEMNVNITCINGHDRAVAWKRGKSIFANCPECGEEAEYRLVETLSKPEEAFAGDPNPPFAGDPNPPAGGIPEDPQEP